MITRRSVTNKKIHFKGFQIPLFFALFIGILSISIIYLSIEASTKGSILADLEYNQQQLMQENEDLTQQLITNSSLTRLSEIAEKDGFVRPQKIIYIGSQDTLAKLP